MLKSGLITIAAIRRLSGDVLISWVLKTSKNRLASVRSLGTRMTIVSDLEMNYTGKRRKC